MTYIEAVRLCERLISLAILLQTIEFLKLQYAYSDQGVWRWKTICRDFSSLPKPLYTFFKFTLPFRIFRIILLIRFLCALLLLVYSSPWSLFFLLSTTFLISIRWRGVFNGGSDYMNLIILTGLFITSLDIRDHKLLLSGMFWIIFNFVASYFVSGIIKLKNKNWRNGTCLVAFLKPQLLWSRKPLLFEQLIKPNFSRIASWGVITFEVLFPLSLVSKSLCLVFLVGSMIFHLFNHFVFGLNRFLWTWIPVYPLIYVLSGDLF